MHSRLIPLVLAGILAVTACSGGSDPADPATTGTSGQSPSGLPIPTLAVADTFGPATWGIALPESSTQSEPLVTANRAVFLDGAQVRAVDAEGQDAWAAPYDEVNPETRSQGEISYPFLRLADPQTVAVVDQGRAKGDGLNEDTYTVSVTLINLDTGAVVKQLTLPGTSSDGPKPSKMGLGFTLPEKPGASAVLPSGEIRKLPTTVTAGGKKYQVSGGTTVGNNGIAVWESEAQTEPTSSGSGFSGKGWDSATTAPTKEYTSASIEAADADKLIIGRWVVPGGGPTRAKVQIQILDAASGTLLSTPKCAPDETTNTLTASPNRQHFVNGSLRLDADGQAECIGGGPNQKSASLSAVGDTGRAFGYATGELIDIAPDGSVKTSPIPDGTRPPIGIMTGDVAIHWDGSQAVITGNPIQP